MSEGIGWMGWLSWVTGLLSAPSMLISGSGQIGLKTHKIGNGCEKSVVIFSR